MQSISMLRLGIPFIGLEAVRKKSGGGAEQMRSL